MLARRLPKSFRLIAPDLPGHGDSMSNLDISYRVEAQADRLRAFLEVWGVEHVHLIGNSMGGAIAANFAARYPRHVASLTLLNAAGAGSGNGDNASEMAGLWQSSGENPAAGHEQRGRSAGDAALGDVPAAAGARLRHRGDGGAQGGTR
ncbi:alpha/beta hydrolase [Chromobacterium haemolyticum]|nr:alpha/beta hydrolase [Chromobacterium haemolyticum]